MENRVLMRSLTKCARGQVMGMGSTKWGCHVATKHPNGWYWEATGTVLVRITYMVPKEGP